METAAIFMIGLGLFLMYSAINDWNPFQTAKVSLNTGKPTVVKYGS